MPWLRPSLKYIDVIIAISYIYVLLNVVLPTRVLRARPGVLKYFVNILEEIIFITCCIQREYRLFYRTFGVEYSIWHGACFYTNASGVWARPYGHRLVNLLLQLRETQHHVNTRID